MKTIFKHLYNKTKPLANSLLFPLLERVDIKYKDLKFLKDLNSKYAVLYVFGTKNIVDFSLFQQILSNEKLPAVSHVFPENSFFINPLKRLSLFLGKHLLQLDKNHQLKLISDDLLAGKPALISLYSLKNIFEPEEKRIGDEVLATLLASLQKNLPQKQIVVVPVVPVWDRTGTRNSNNWKDLVDKYIGKQETPGNIRGILQIFSSLFQPIIRISKPLHLKTFIEDNQGIPLNEKAEILYEELAQTIEQEWKMTLGPKLPSPSKIQHYLNKNQKITDLYFESVSSGMKPQDALHEIQSAIREIPASPTKTTLALYKYSLWFIWHRIFKGFELDDLGFEKMREYSSKGPLILIPCHRSHVDYLLISWLMDKYHLPIPHIAAGQNLSFFPMGPIFRMGGAFFIRRSFKGKKLYKQVLLEYLTQLLKLGVNIEFFIEGTRSRTGKAVYPKYGLLSMLGKLVLKNPLPSPQIVPITIGYEKVIEEDSYQTENFGKEKKSEDFLQVLKSASVLLNRYGRVHIRVAQPFDMKDFLGNVNPQSMEFKNKIHQMSLKITHDIVKNTTITSSMLAGAALLAPGLNNLNIYDVFSTYQFYHALSQSQGLVLSQTIADKNQLLRRFKRSLKSFSNIITIQNNKISIQPGKRVKLSYYKNGFIQTVIKSTLTAAVLVANKSEEEYIWLGTCLQREFPYLKPTQLNDFKTEKNKIQELSFPQQVQLSSLIIEFLEGQLLTAFCLRRFFNKHETGTKKELVKFIRKNAFNILENRHFRYEAFNKSIFIETINLLTSDQLLILDKDKNYRSNELGNKLKTFIRSREKFLHSYQINKN